MLNIQEVSPARPRVYLDDNYNFRCEFYDAGFHKHDYKLKRDETTEDRYILKFRGREYYAYLHRVNPAE